MKKILFLAFLMIFLESQAQDYMINFNSTGDTTGLNTIRVINLMKQDTVILTGNQTLHLVSWPVGIKNHNQSTTDVSIYPNPMVDQSTLSFNSPSSGNIVIGIIDLSGKTVYERNMTVVQGENTFRISGLYFGMYLVKVSGSNYSYSTKLLSQSYQNGIMIDYKSSNPSTVKNHLKSVKMDSVVEMTYTDGDRLQYKGVSGTYGNILTDVPKGSKTQVFQFIKCIDHDGRSYPTVRISAYKKKSPNSGGDTLIFMSENLKVGVPVTPTQGQTNNDTIEKYCYDNDTNNCNIYGGLYTWNEMMQYTTLQGVQGICPDNWHLPTITDWQNLIDYYGGDATAGAAMKEVGSAHWLSPNDANDSTGFTALPGGLWYVPQNSYTSIHTNGTFWSSTQYDINNSEYIDFFYGTGYCTLPGVEVKEDAFSVRCVHN